jgi:putative ABC transport system permease protein
MSLLATDLRLALRMLWRNPGTTAAAVLAVALGIGANTAIFSVVDGVLLRPLPFPGSEALFLVNTGSPRLNRYDGPLSYPQYQDVVAQSRAFESVGGWVDGDINLAGGTAPERVLLRVATPSLLPTLGVQPVRGRNFLPEETLRGRVALISHALWQRQFASAEGTVGKTVRLDGADYRIVGILPRAFRLETAVDVWVPLDTADPSLQVRNSHFLRVLARGRPAVTTAGANADLAPIARSQRERFPEMFPPSGGFTFRARPYRDALVGDVRLPLLVLLGAVAFVLLITCANIANLLLARAATREREMAIRTALGARRARLVRQLLVESLLLALGGAALGLLLASWSLDALVALSPPSLPRLSEVALDRRVLLFTAVVAIGTGIAFGLVPALAASRPDLHDALKEGSRGATGGRSRLRRGLVTAEVALSLVLLVGAGLMGRSFLRLRQVDPGFRPDHALTLRVSLPVPDSAVTARDTDRFVDFFTRATARLRQLPGVLAAGAGNIVPLDGNMTDRLIDIEGYQPRDAADMPDAQNRQVTSGWFAALGMPLLRGRVIEESDDARAPLVVVVNQSFARRYFPAGEAVGRRLRLGRLTHEFPWATIVGVVGDVRGSGLDAPFEPEMYWPVAQIRNTPAMAIVVRTRGEPAAMAGAVRTALAEVDPGQPVFDVQTLEQLVSSSLGQRRFTLTLMLVFGVMAVGLAAVGLYGVMAYLVSRRTREIGIRVALGAHPARVLGMVVRDGMGLVAVGLAIGTACALALTRLTASMVYGVSTTDAGTYLGTAAVLAAVALVATLLPARRALAVDPVHALRAE